MVGAAIANFGKLGKMSTQKEGSNKTTYLSPISHGNRQISDISRVANTRALVDDSQILINMRSIVLMDHEPQSFIHLFDGALVIRTNDSIKYKNPSLDEEVMMF